MNITVKEEKLLVISDLHIGCPANRIHTNLTEFFKFCADHDYNLCINGDGLDVVQGSMSTIARKLPDYMNQMTRMRKKGLKIYYVIGNHDIVLEHFLFDWNLFELVPFLNVESNGQRIRIEHGHLYDPMFVNRPHVYEALTWIAGKILLAAPGIYWWWTKIENRFFGVRDDSAGDLSGEMKHLLRAVEAITRRGFDWVIFGHTHRAGIASVSTGKKYMNLGSWLVKPYFAKIEDGNIELVQWEGAS